MGFIGPVGRMFGVPGGNGSRRIDPASIANLFTPRPSTLPRGDVIYSDIFMAPYRGPLDLDNYGRETESMRRDYRRQAIAEPLVKAAVQGKVNAVASLEVSVMPGGKTPLDGTIAEFVKDTVRLAPGGWSGLIRAMLTAGIIDGFSILEKTRKPQLWQGRWRWGLEHVRSLDTAWLKLELDVYRNVVMVVNLIRGLEYYEPDRVLLYTHNPLFSNPFGTSDLRAATRAANIIEDVYKVWYVALKRFGLPYFVGKTAAEKKAVMEEALAALYAGGYAATGEDDAIEVLNLASATGVSAFKDGVQTWREDILFAIRGAALPFLEGDGGAGAHGDSETQKVSTDVNEEILAIDCMEVVNHQLIPWLVAPNFGKDVDMPRAVLGGTNWAEIGQVVDLVGKAQQAGKKISARWFDETTKIPPPDGPDDELQPVGAGDPDGGGGTPGSQPAALPGHEPPAQNAPPQPPAHGGSQAPEKPPQTMSAATPVVPATTVDMDRVAALAAGLVLLGKLGGSQPAPALMPPAPSAPTATFSAFDDDATDPHQAATLALFDYLIACKEDGTDPSAGLDEFARLASDLTAFDAVMDDGGEAFAAVYQEDKHPRDDHGRYVSKDAIHDAKTDPAKAAELRARVTKPEQRAKLDAAIGGEHDLGRTKKGQQRHDAAERRRSKEASAAKAREILSRVNSSGVSPEDLEELAAHLPALSVAKLRSARAILQTSWGGKSPTRDAMVARLVEHVRERAQRPDEDTRPTRDGLPSNWKDASADNPGKPKPSDAKPGGVRSMPIDDLHVDPSRFQFKLNTGNAAGVTDELKQVHSWNPDFAGVISVWKDPADGKTYVVNGHHRRELAGRLGVTDMDVRYIEAKDAKEARAKGALINIAEGRGTAIDAAKFMRDAGVTVEDFAKHGVPLKAGALADQATTLTKLNDKAFDRLAAGDLDMGKALAVAKHLDDPTRQEKLFKLLEKREDEGKDISTRTMEELARSMAAAPSVTKTEETLWGTEETTEDVFVQRAELAGHVRAELAKELTDYGVLSSTRRAEKTKGAGNVLNVDENKKRAEAAEQAKNLYDHLVNRKGPISDALNAGAEKLANAKTKKERERVRTETADAVRGAVAAEFEQLNRKPGETDRGGEGGALPRDHGPPEPGPAGGDGAGRPGAEPAGLTGDAHTHATTDHTSALAGIAPGESGHVAGHFVRRGKDGSYQIETGRGYHTGDAASVNDRIRRNWDVQRADAGDVKRAMERVEKNPGPDPFFDAKGAEAHAKGRAAVPHGTRGVSLDPNTHGRTGTVVRDDEAGKSHLKLDNGDEEKATDFEPLDPQHSWRAPAAKPEAAPKAEAKPLFDTANAGDGTSSAPKESPTAPDHYTANGLPFRGRGDLADDKLTAEHLPHIERRLAAIDGDIAGAHAAADKESDPFVASERRGRADELNVLKGKLESARDRLEQAPPPGTLPP